MMMMMMMIMMFVITFHFVLSPISFVKDSTSTGKGDTLENKEMETELEAPPPASKDGGNEPTPEAKTPAPNQDSTQTRV